MAVRDGGGGGLGNAQVGSLGAQCCEWVGERLSVL
jgi:hypothetical protein